VILETQGLGYLLGISLHTYSAIQGKKECKLYTHHYLRVDKNNSHPVLFGFVDENERDLFTKLISVSGVGPNTARVVLSSASPAEIINAIITGNEPMLKSIKGIGPKAAQRLILELKDKLNLPEKDGSETGKMHNTAAVEALSALVMLGFNKAKAQSAINQVVTSDSTLGEVEELIKEALKIL